MGRERVAQCCRACTCVREELHVHVYVKTVIIMYQDSHRVVFWSHRLEIYTKLFRLDFVPLTNTLNVTKSIASAIRSHCRSSAFKSGLFTPLQKDPKQLITYIS